MSCSNSDESSCGSSHFFIASLPEIKRYIKISSM